MLTPGILYRETPTAAPQPVEVIGWKYHRYVVREVGKVWPGIFLADFGQLILPKQAIARAGA
jgi:hypothetical protein